MKAAGILIFASMLIAAPAICGTTVADSIFSGGVYRTYRLYVPTAYTGTQKVPMVLNLHGLGSSAFEQQYYGDFSAIADTAGFLVLHPQGTGGASPYWNTGVAAVPDDVAFLLNLIDSVSKKYLVDHDRVYACGFSNGGVMSYYLACNTMDRFAAIADVGGTMLYTWLFSCRPKTALPVMQIHGNNDNVVPYAGTNLYVHQDSITKKWVRYNRCNPVPQIIGVPDTSSTDFSTARQHIYSGGVDGSSVETYTINNGGHSWPGAPVFIDLTNKDFSASVEIWRFFRQFRLSQFTTLLSIGTYNADENKMVLRDHRLYLSGFGRRCAVYDLHGRMLVQGNDNGNGISLENLASGIYVAVADDHRPLKFVISAID